MACACAPTLIAYRDEVNKVFPNRDKASDGCCASSTHTGQNPFSDHEPGAKGATRGFAHAYDLDEDLGPTSSLMWLVPHLLRDHRTKYIIYEKRLYYPDGTVKVYTGPNPHDKHLHLSVKPDATFDKAGWGIAAAWTASQAPPPRPDSPVVASRQPTSHGAAMHATTFHPVSGDMFEVGVGPATDPRNPDFGPIWFRSGETIVQCHTAKAQNLGGLLKDASVFVDPNNIILVSGQGIDNKIYYCHFQADWTWSAWTPSENIELHP